MFLVFDSNPLHFDHSPNPSVQPAGSWKVVIEASPGLLSPLTHALFLLCPAPHSWESQNTSWISDG